MDDAQLAEQIVATDPGFLDAVRMRRTNAKPFLRYAGGKRQLLPELLRRLPPSWKDYHEPFVGGGALFFALRRLFPRAGMNLGDANDDLMVTYRALRDDVEGVIRNLQMYATTHRERGADFYREVRAADRRSMAPEGRAAWMIYLNRTSFNGLWRVNKAGVYNVPYGKLSNPTICDALNLRAVSADLQGASLGRGVDFRVTTGWVRPGDLVYLDPPYVPVAATSFVAYAAGGFGVDQQIALRDEAMRLRDIGAHVILSNSGAPLVRELYAGWTIEEVSARRNINRNGAGRGPVPEVIITP